MSGARILRFQNRNPLVFQILEFFSQETYNFQKLTNETLVVADRFYVKISKLASFNIKLLLKEDNILYILNESN